MFPDIATIYKIMGPAFWPLLLSTFAAAYGIIRCIGALFSQEGLAAAAGWLSLLGKVSSFAQAAGLYGTCYSILYGLSSMSPDNPAKSLPVLTLSMGTAMATTVWGLIIALSAHAMVLFVQLFNAGADV